MNRIKAIESIIKRYGRGKVGENIINAAVVHASIMFVNGHSAWRSLEAGKNLIDVWTGKQGEMKIAAPPYRTGRFLSVTNCANVSKK